MSFVLKRRIRSEKSRRMRQRKESVVVQLIGIWYLGKVTFSRWCVNTLNLFVIFMI